jgi:hypothetical protein
MVSFVIENFNYFDLSKETCPKKVSSHHVAKSAGTADDMMDDDDEDTYADGPKDVVDHIVSKTSKMEQDVTNKIEDSVREVREKFPPLPWTKNKGASLLQADACVLTRRSLKATKARTKKCETVMDVFRDAIKEVVMDIITCMSITLGEVKEYQFAPPPGIASAPSATVQLIQPQSTAFLRGVAPAPAVPQVSHGLPGSSDVEIMVSFSPGEAVGGGQSINVDVGILSISGASVDHLQGFGDLLQKAIASGALAKEIEQALQIITGVAAKLGGFKLARKKVAPFNMAKCEGHVKSIITQFSKTYTKERVPMALYNECTNFVTKLSFSHDRVLDPRDTRACKETTASFAKHWKFGEKAEDYDFEFMCKRACEAKFGENASMCKAPGAGPAPGPASAPSPAVAKESL